MKLSRRLHRQVEIKIRHAMAVEMSRKETAALPDPTAKSKPLESESPVGR